MICEACGQATKDPRPVDALDSFAAFLDRMERVLAARVGAGARIDEAWDERRWSRELAADLPQAVGALSDVRGHLTGARTAADVHAAFARMRGRLVDARERIA